MKYMPSIILFAAVCVSLFVLISCHSVSGGCFCRLSVEQVEHIRHDGTNIAVTQHHCELKIDDSNKYEDSLEKASYCCCKATFDVEKAKRHLYFRRIEGCEVVAC